MLVCHSHRFIFLKTVKTAGTSVEVAFEHFCLPPGTPSVEFRDEVVSPQGIVGARPRRDNSYWWNHMPAGLLRQQLGDDKWDSYFRFSIVRNPFDAAVSMFWWQHRDKLADIKTAAFSEIREAFQSWIRDATSPLPTNAGILFQNDGSLQVHDVIRYENLADDVGRIHRRLGLTFEAGRLGSFKSDIRPKGQGALDYYDRTAAEIVATRFAHYRGHFGYDLDWRP